MKKAALFPAEGIGDALLTLVAAHTLHLAGWETTLYHNQIQNLSSWFPRTDLKPLPQTLNSLEPFDLIIAQNDNSSRISELIEHYRPSLSLFYPTYSAKKHTPLHERDYVFDPSLPMVHNLTKAAQSLCGIENSHNGICIPKQLHHRLFSKRILIHPTSREAKKNWTPQSFVSLAKKLSFKGWYPLFVVSPKEYKEWQWIEHQGLDLQAPQTLADFATLLYESGYLIGNDSFAGHLASNLSVPSVIIASCPKHMQLWRPGWHKASLVYPPTYLPKKIKRRYWQKMTSVRSVLSKVLAQTLSTSDLQ